jgi:hypothetical protein
MPKKKVTEELEEVQLEDVKLALRNKINKEYGSVPAFLETDFGKSLGGMKIRPNQIERRVPSMRWFLCHISA